jgi:hypothetical protein
MLQKISNIEEHVYRKLIIVQKQLVLQFLILLRYYKCGANKFHLNSVFKLLLGVFARSAASSASRSALFVV